MKKSMMMKSAHKLAKEILNECGNNYSIALSVSLKEVWRQVKLYDKKRFGDVAIITAAQRLTTTKAEKESRDYVYGVPAWIIRKNLNQNEAYAVLNQSNNMKVERETEKAELIKFDTDFGTVTMWAPKSVLKVA